MEFWRMSFNEAIQAILFDLALQNVSIKRLILK